MIIFLFIHSVLFFLMLFSLFYLLYAAITGRYGWAIIAAMAFILADGISIALNRGRCPLTTLAERYGAANGAVTHLFMPQFIAGYMFKFFIALFTIEIVWLGIGYFSSHRG